MPLLGFIYGYGTVIGKTIRIRQITTMQIAVNVSNYRISITLYNRVKKTLSKPKSLYHKRKLGITFKCIKTKCTEPITSGVIFEGHVVYCSGL